MVSIRRFTLLLNTFLSFVAALYFLYVFQTFRSKIIIPVINKHIGSVKRNIAFVKTHVTGASEVQNILFRYGTKYRLKIALPKMRYTFGYPRPFSAKYVSRSGLSADANIICHHMRFSHKEVKRLLPSDTVYVTILSEPGELFQSTFRRHYKQVPEFQHVSRYRSNSMERWLRALPQYWDPMNLTDFSFFARNHLMFDLGFSEAMETKTEVTEAIREIAQIFDLVLIADHMDESLVLLAELLNCPLRDVAALRLSGRHVTYASGERARRIREGARFWNRADSALFDYFNVTLWRKVEIFGVEKMKSRVKKLQSITRKLMFKCMKHKQPVQAGLKWIFQADFLKLPHGFSPQLKNEAIDVQECRDLIGSEFYWTPRLRRRYRR